MHKVTAFLRRPELIPPLPRQYRMQWGQATSTTEKLNGGCALQVEGSRRCCSRMGLLTGSPNDKSWSSGGQGQHFKDQRWGVGKLGGGGIE